MGAGGQINPDGVVQRSPGLPTDSRQPWVREKHVAAILKGLCRPIDAFSPREE